MGILEYGNISNVQVMLFQASCTVTLPLHLWVLWAILVDPCVSVMYNAWPVWVVESGLSFSFIRENIPDDSKCLSYVCFIS